MAAAVAMDCFGGLWVFIKNAFGCGSGSDVDSDGMTTLLDSVESFSFGMSVTTRP